MGPNRQLPTEVTRYKKGRPSIHGSVAGWVPTRRFREINDPAATRRVGQRAIFKEYDPRPHAYIAPTQYNSSSPDFIQDGAPQQPDGQGGGFADRLNDAGHELLPPDQIGNVIDHEQAMWLMHRFVNGLHARSHERTVPIDGNTLTGDSIGPRTVETVSGGSSIGQVWNDALSRPTYDASALTEGQFEEAMALADPGFAAPMGHVGLVSEEDSIDQMWNGVLSRPTYDASALTDGEFDDAMATASPRSALPVGDFDAPIEESFGEQLQPGELQHGGFAPADGHHDVASLDYMVAQEFSAAPDQLNNMAMESVEPDMPLDAIVEDDWHNNPRKLMDPFGMPPGPGMMPGMPMQFMDPFMMGPFGGPGMGPMM